MIGPIKLLSNGIFSFSKLISKHWYLIIIFMIILPGFISSVNEGSEQKDFRIPLRYLGNNVVSADEGIYSSTIDLEFESQEKEDIEKIGYSLEFGWYLIQNLWKPLGLFLLWFYSFFKLGRFVMGDDSKSLRAFILSIFIMAFLQLIMEGVPFRGIWSLGKFIWGVF